MPYLADKVWVRAAGVLSSELNVLTAQGAQVCHCINRTRNHLAAKHGTQHSAAVSRQCSRVTAVIAPRGCTGIRSKRDVGSASEHCGRGCWEQPVHQHQIPALLGPGLKVPSQGVSHNLMLAGDGRLIHPGHHTALQYCLLIVQAWGQGCCCLPHPCSS